MLEEHKPTDNHLCPPDIVARATHEISFILLCDLAFASPPTVVKSKIENGMMLDEDELHHNIAHVFVHEL